VTTADSKTQRTTLDLEYFITLLLHTMI
jgi:hypothetical protein